MNAEVHPSVVQMLRRVVSAPFKLLRAGVKGGKSISEETVEATGDKEIVRNFRKNVQDITPASPEPTPLRAPGPTPPGGH